MADTPTGETVTPGDSQTTVTTASTPPQDNASAAEVEQLRKAKEQSDLRIRQLENEKKARDDAEAEAQRKRLEEKDEWKQIAEQERIKREALETERETEQRSQQLTSATNQIFAEFPKDAVELAQEMGLTLADDSEAAREQFKTKLSNIAAKVSNQTTTTPNNPAAPPASADKAELLARMGNGDKEARASLIGNIPGVQAMKKQAGWVD